MPKQAITPSSPVFATKDGSTIFDKFGYSAAVRSGDLLFVSGQIGLNPDGSLPADDATQIVNAFERLKLVCEAGGAKLDAIVDLLSYHVEMQRHWTAFVEIKGRYFTKPYPAWTAIGVAGLARPGLVIEIKAIARL
jgi:enamine deaminase RidA (YjgF/YER057c/UK114 family)